MTRSFPPRPTQGADIDMLDQVLGCVSENHDLWYVSTPITTGRRFAEWMKREGAKLDELDAHYAASLQRHVVKPNMADARRVVSRLRAGHIVVDPTSLPDLPGWTQADYHTLWWQVIEHHVSVVVFLDGWEQSDGCSYEYLCAVTHNIDARRQDLAPLNVHEAIELLETAVGEDKESEFRRAVLKAIRNTANRQVSE